MHLSPCVNAALTDVLPTHDAVCAAAVSRHRESPRSCVSRRAGDFLNVTVVPVFFCSTEAKSHGLALNFVPSTRGVSFSYLSLQWRNKKAMENLQFLTEFFYQSGWSVSVILSAPFCHDVTAISAIFS